MLFLGLTNASCVAVLISNHISASVYVVLDFVLLNEYPDQKTCLTVAFPRDEKGLTKDSRVAVLTSNCISGTNFQNF